MTQKVQSVKVPDFPNKHFVITEFGAVGDGCHSNTAAINKAIETCAASGGGTVVIPRGIWLTGPIRLQSRVRLHTDEGALVTFSRKWEEYPLILSNYEGLKAVRAMPALYGEQLQQVAITGSGIFDGSGDAWRPVRKHEMTEQRWNDIVQAGGVVDDNDVWWPTEEAMIGRKHTEALQAEGNYEIAHYERYQVYLRPVLLGLTACTEILLDGPTFQNSGSWCLHPRLCEHVTIRNVKVRNPWYSVNGDGLDLESCRFANIHDCMFDVGDDAICLKSGKNQQGRETAAPTEYISIRNCTVYHGHGGFTVGSEMSGDIRHVDVSDCTFIGTDNGLRFKSTRGRGGIVEHIQIANIQMKDIIDSAIVLDMYYEIKQDEVDRVEVTEETPCFRHISIKDTVSEGSSKAIFIRGLPEMPIHDLHFERVTVAANTGIVCIDAQDILFQDVSITPKSGAVFTQWNSRNIRVIDHKLKPVWFADLGNSQFRNPILYADYSDPDVVRVGEDFYMTASSFNSSPGLPILHSKDLVNWTVIAYAIDRLPDSYNAVRHGEGVWAPSIRYHDGKFWIFFSAPDEGIYMTTAENAAGPWSPLHMVKEVKGWIDPCPLWDEDGSAYLVHAFAKSRTGIKSKLKICPMRPDGTALLGDGEIIFDGTEHHPTIEGPKLYKRNGYYYIFAPAGGVPIGWQTILRSKQIMGPYEDKIVLHQGDSPTNGPHQGGYVELDSGEAWFLHFQDREAYGRIVHLQPMSWENDWPVMGIDTNGDGIGEPVLIHAKPNVGREYPFAVPETSDDFDAPSLGLQWQWQANYRKEWYSLTANPGSLRLYAQQLPNHSATLYESPNVLCQKFPAPVFTATTKLSLQHMAEEDLAGLTVFGHAYRYTALQKTDLGSKLVFVEGSGNKESSSEEITETVAVPYGIHEIYLRVDIELEASCMFAYSWDGASYSSIGGVFEAVPGGWVGAKLGLFCLNKGEVTSPGYVDIDWFQVD